MRVALGMMLVLMLCCAGCTSSRAIRASVGGPMGNAIAMTLPVGTELRLESPALARDLGQVLANETLTLGPGVLVTTTPLKLCTVEYLEERDLAEMQLILQLNALRARQKSDALK